MQDSSSPSETVRGGTTSSVSLGSMLDGGLSNGDLMDRPGANGLVKWVKQVFGGGRCSDASLKDALEEVIQGHEDDDEVLSSEEKDMLRNMLSVGEMTVHDVMIPRTDIVGVEYDITLTELKEILQQERHTRMPVYVDSLDKLVGFIHLKDMVSVLSGDEPFDMDTLLRDIMFVSPSMKVVDLLVQMRLSGGHMAIVVDEYGGTDGLVTMEDLFESIVGEIQDEHDMDDQDEGIKQIARYCFEVDARTDIEDLEDVLGVQLREEGDDYDTVGGLIFHQLGRVPARGEIARIAPIGRFEIIDADPRRIKKVRVTLKRRDAMETVAGG